MSRSYKKAVEDKCKSCIYDKDGPGTWRQQVETCTCPECPLYPVRPRASKPMDETAYKEYHNA